MLPPGLVLPGVTMLWVLWPTVSVTAQGERLSVSKPPFWMTGPAHDADAAVVAAGEIEEESNAGAGEATGTTATINISGSASLLQGKSLSNETALRGNGSQNMSRDS